MFHYLLGAAPIGFILSLIILRLWLDARGAFRCKTGFLDGAALREVAEAREGERVAIIGRVVGGASLVAPLTGRPCVYFASEVLGPGSGYTSGRGSPSASLRIIASKVERADIEVRDGSGAACVSAGAEALVFVSPERRLMFGAGTYRDRERAFLEAHGFPQPRNWWQRWVERSRGFDERILVPGDLVVLGGIARWEAEPSGARREARRLRIEAPPDGPVVINADPDSIAHAERTRRKP